MTTGSGLRIVWSEDFIVIDAALPLAAALQQIAAASAAWIVIRRHQGQHLYAFAPNELIGRLRTVLLEPGADPNLPLEAALGLRETYESTQTPSRAAVPPIDRSWRGQAAAPSIERYVEVGPQHQPLAVGRADALLGGRAHAPHAARSAGLPRAAPPAEPTLEDEGTTPVRHPSIDIAEALRPGTQVTVLVDLLREVDVRTDGGPVNVGALAADWSTLDLTVHLQSAALDFGAAAQGTVTMRRNAASLPARLSARVRADAAAKPTAVTATFLLGARFCGTATRMFDVGADAQPMAPGGAAPTPNAGLVVVEPKAEPPDVTVHISRLDKEHPGRLRWLVVTERFDGLPPSLEEDIDLGRDPAAEASALFKEFAVLVRGQHTQHIEGFGSRLWNTAPAMFRAVYWQLCDHYRRPLAIQFISDEPHLPWELMRPARADDSEIHPPLALGHAVARWIKRWDGYMRNQLPAGHICTIAPKYANAGRALKRAQTESDKLVADFGATRASGTRAAVLALLETAPPAEPVAVLHFAGHGKFAPEAASQSAIKLEDGELAASEVERPEVRLGRACRSLVFFNACEVGAAGAVFGEVGGWADAFLGRQFGGFIAPLWSVDDEDAGVVAAELLDKIFKQRQPIGAALRGIRAAHGATSPTFYSYLFYGDVNAQFAA